MKIEGIDRIVIAVKNLDKAAEFLSKLLGVEFEEVTNPVAAEGGVRFTVGAIPQKCTLSIELIQPLDPLKDIRPPDPKAIAKSVEQVDAALHALVFRVKDTSEVSAETGKRGIRIYGKVEMEKIDDGPFSGVTNFKELFSEGEDTLGINMAFVEYQEPTNNKKG